MVKATVTYVVEVEIDDRDLVMMSEDTKLTMIKVRADLIMQQTYIDPEVVIHEI